eukprot:CAMPEP_0115226134 /NCGR_PEP_ID=MMETSP0270-20121206/30467_1 /TAXON_ID=71861 /ORGANISM="Scrippsiella trochoidea, Strain CCMP3099" /LENGTH=455 /DNA_ID=CAMNT_0002640533 /DNA_START=1 /DNA_END=1368 /DNA_ORIENTATION=+
MMPSADIQAKLVYSKDDGQRHWIYVRPRNEHDKHETDYGGEKVNVSVLVRDARGSDPKLDQHAFELVEQQTSLSTQEFYSDAEKIRTVYYAEMAELIKKATGASHVIMFHHQVRNRDLNTGNIRNIHTPVQPYAASIHSDSHHIHAEDMFRRFVPSADRKRLGRGRFLYINAWRNISETPISNDHLAVCDESSLVKPDDYITSDLFGEGYSLQQYGLSHRNAAQHRWFYYSAMRKDEVLLFKQWDSDSTLSGRVCFHTSFSDPNAPRDAPCRQSIEARGIAFFPDHEPNTCPTLDVEQEEVGGGAQTGEELSAAEAKEAEAFVEKLYQAISAFSSWPEPGKQWVKGELARGQSGIETIARTLADDQGNNHGFKAKRPAVKAEVARRLLAGNFGTTLQERCLAWEASSTGSGSRGTARMASVRSGAVAALQAAVWVALGFGLGFTLRARRGSQLSR